MTNFRKTKSSIAICPFFIWTSENIEGLGHSENDVNLTFCQHPENVCGSEGNCQKEYCPLCSVTPSPEPESTPPPDQL